MPGVFLATSAAATRARPDAGCGLLRGTQRTVGDDDSEDEEVPPLILLQSLSSSERQLVTVDSLVQSGDGSYTRDISRVCHEE